MSYRQKDSANRDALFGPSKKKTGAPKHLRNNESNRDALFGSVGASKSGSKTKKSSTRPKSSSSSRPAPAETTSRPKASEGKSSTARGYNPKARPKIGSGLTGAAKVAKLKEAEEYRDKAVKAMERGVFSRPDPIAAGNYYRRAADAYGLCGENRLERLHRVASADCQMGTGSFPTAAAEYMKAAVLSKTSDETIERKRKEGWKLYSDAAKAWTNAGEVGKAANCQIQAAMAWIWEDETTMIDKQALIGIEEAIEAHVPDVLNIYARYRQTGTSKYVDPDAPVGQKPSEATLSLAKDHVINVPYAHEPLQDVANVLVHYGEYQSAIYAVGATSYILENNGVATLTLSRSFVMETILSLAMGDPVAAEEQFLNRHVQKTFYLSSRECRLAEELFRAILHRDIDGLEEARSPSGPNRAALANLTEKFRNLVLQLRISGAARRALPSSGPKKTVEDFVDSDDEETSELLATPKTDEPERTPPTRGRKGASRKDEDDDDDLDPDALAGELDDVMKGLDDLDDLDDFDDDDIDLR